MKKMQCTRGGVLLSHREERNDAARPALTYLEVVMTPRAAAWTDLEVVTLSEVRQTNFTGRRLHVGSKPGHEGASLRKQEQT